MTLVKNTEVIYHRFHRFSFRPLQAQEENAMHLSASRRIRMAQVAALNQTLIVGVNMALTSCQLLDDDNDPIKRFFPSMFNISGAFWKSNRHV